MFIIQCKAINKSIVWTRDAKRSSRTAAALMSNKKRPINSDDTADRSFYYVGGMNYSSSPEYSLFDLFRDEIFF